MSAEAARLVKLARDNPWHLFTQGELADIMGVSEKAIRALKSAGAPFVFDKSTPQLLTSWIADGHVKVGKTS